jgi:peptidyl-tRNA hydrolase, PTH1 family
LIVGLGNVGDQYQATRHNAGFWFIDEFAEEHNLSFRPEQRFHGAVCKLGSRWLLKPSTLMNRSGSSVAALANYYKISTNSILVIHDELDLPVDTVRLKQSGGHGGHNGLRDIINHCGKEFWRLRVGIGHPGDRKQVIDYVLNKPSLADRQQINLQIQRALAVMSLLLAGETQKAMHQLHSK